MPKPPHNQRGKQNHLATPSRQQVSITQSWSGPLPAPSDVERYDQIIPGGAERILAMAEKEQEHRIQYEKIGLPASIKESARGQYLGAVISLTAVGGAIFTAYIGAHWMVPVTLVGVPVLGIVKAIVKPSED